MLVASSFSQPNEVVAVHGLTVIFACGIAHEGTLISRSHVTEQNLL